jgi:L-ascorbate metabolism protein UlaG (beta-lactamase superfamily)
MGPGEAVAVHEILKPRTSVGIHYGTFSLADDGETEPQEGLRRALEAARPETPFVLLPEGEAGRF